MESAYLNTTVAVTLTFKSSLFCRTSMDNRGQDQLDEIDRIIMGILTTDPRIPYNDIAMKLSERGYEMSSEGVRHRVLSIFDITSTFFMLDPSEHGWHVLRVAISVDGGGAARDRVLDELKNEPVWFTGGGIGTFDIYAVATTPSMQKTDRLLNNIQGIDDVNDVAHFLETERKIDISKYIPNHQ